MRKLIIIFSICIFILLALVVCEGLYIVKLGAQLSKYKTEISKLEKLNSEMRSENKDLGSSNTDLKEENKYLKDLLGENLPINIRQQECMKKQNYTTAAMNNCTYAAIDEWYKEIDNTILLLKNHMTKRQYNLLVDSQNKWKAYEIAERKLYNETIGTFVGTMYTTVLAGKNEELAENRARELSGLYHYMSDTGIMKN